MDTKNDCRMDLSREIIAISTMRVPEKSNSFLDSRLGQRVSARSDLSMSVQ